jgi:peptidoglycan hydrolase CwlO-like protein
VEGANGRKQAALKSGKSGIQQQLDSIKAKIEREQNDLKAKRGKINYRSVDEIDREIKFPLHKYGLTVGNWRKKSTRGN